MVVRTEIRIEIIETKKYCGSVLLLITQSKVRQVIYINILKFVIITDNNSILYFCENSYKDKYDTH